MKIRVYFEDTDIGGIVYHSNYINFCERARSEVLFENGLSPFDAESQSGFVVKSLKCDFLKSATLGDLLDVETKVLSVGKVKFSLLQEIFKDGQKLFSMEIELVNLANGRPARLDEYFVKLFG